MTFSRRSFLAGSSALAMSSAPIIGRAQGNDKIIFASILDLSGGLDIYGAPMAETTKMAIDDINDAGGLLGREVELHNTLPKPLLEIVPILFTVELHLRAERQYVQHWHALNHCISTIRSMRAESAIIIISALDPLLRKQLPKLCRMP